MMISIRQLRRVAGALVAALLFAHGAIAFAGCELPGRAPAAALAVQPCHEQDVAPNLCLMHCLAGDQSLDKPLVQVPELPAAPVLQVRLDVAPLRPSLAAARRFVPPAAAPPIRILFRSLLI